MIYDTFTVACTGTSLTDSWSARNWTYEAQEMLQVGKRQRVRFFTNARQGQVSRWGFENIGKITAQRPDAVLIEFNMNDSSIVPNAHPDDVITLQESYDYHVAMIDAIRAARPDTLIWLMTMNNPNNNNGQLQYRGALPEYNAQYFTIAAAKNLVGVIDNYPEWVARGEAQSYIDTPDGSHPELFALREVLIPNVVEALAPFIR